MRRFQIGSAFGIPIRVDLTFLLVLPLFAWIISRQIGDWTGILNDVAGAGLDAAALASSPLPLVLGVLAALGLFAGVVLHELGHSVVAIRYGYRPEEITLWLFGGIAQLKEMPENWKQELAIAVAGPIVSVLVGAISSAVFLVIPAADTVPVTSARFIVGYLALMNVGLAVFNMLPGFPMDGGRVLRALLSRTRPHAQATRIAAEVGKVFAILLGLFGLFGGGGLFLVAMAFFIYIGASSEAQTTTMRAAFEGLSVRDVMTPADRVTTVRVDDSVAELIDLMFRERHTGYPVETEGEIVGLVTLGDAQAVREIERSAYRAGEVMSTELYTVEPDAEVMDAHTELSNRNVGRLLVMEDGEFRGLITRSDIMSALAIIKSSGRFGTDQTETTTGRSVVRPDDREFGP
jgi:Zn-dependent protease/CBS domain-containing protein